MTETKYYHYFGRQLRIEIGENGERVGSVLDWRTGQFMEAEDRIVGEAMINMTSADIWRMTFKEFVTETESTQATYVSGEGPVFPLYQIVKGIFDDVEREDRRLTHEEIELIDKIYSQTFALWEAGEALS